tara:strand:+ start:500 stop:802 length:303 start_codon:yes stop_codon:yes gene_type:complete
MKNFSFLILALAFFIGLPSYSDSIDKKNNSIRLRKRFEKIDENGDGLISKEEMMKAHRDRIEKLFMNFDSDGDNNLSKKELRAVKKEMKKRINKSNNEEA